MRRPVEVKWVLLFFRWTSFVLPAESPLSPPFHPHSLMSDRSLGASWVFSFQPVLPPDCRPLSVSRGKWARRLTQSPELGAWAFDFSFLRMFGLYAAAGIAIRWL